MNQNKSFQKLSIFIVTLAVAALSCSGASDITNLFATETPIPTNTFTPSPTFTPRPTPTATQTPSPTPLPTGVKTEEQSDGSTLFIDYDNQYQLALPEGWIVIPLSSEDLADILQSMSDENPEFKDMAQAFKQLDPNVIRVMAVNKDSKYISNGFSTNLSITALEDKLMSSMPLDFVVGAVEESLNQQGAELLSNGSLAARNANGVEFGSFDFLQTSLSATGASVQVRSKVVVFQTDGKLIMVQLATPEQFGEELLPVMDKISDSIKLMEP